MWGWNSARICRSECMSEAWKGVWMDEIFYAYLNFSNSLSEQKIGNNNNILTRTVTFEPGLHCSSFGFSCLFSCRVIGSNSCQLNNGGCSQLCLPTSETTRTCVCTVGYNLQKNRMACKGKMACSIYFNQLNFQRSITMSK